MVRIWAKLSTATVRVVAEGDPPKEFGITRWRGGPGKPGMMGGWGYECNFCNLGDLRSADPKKSVSNRELTTHVIAIHGQRREVVEYLRSLNGTPAK